MTATHNAGPLIVFGASPTGLALEYNPDRGPSVFDQGSALADPRLPFAYQPGSVTSQDVCAIYSTSDMPVISQVPYTATVNNIAASQTPSAGVALTKVSSSAAGVTVGQSIVRSDTGATVTGLLALDGASAKKTFGQGSDGLGGPVNIWDPTTLIARAVKIVSVGDDSGGTFTVRGYDIYSYPITETITGAAVGTANGKKAFKYIASITPAGTLSGSAVTVGTTDIIGLPVRADYFFEYRAAFNNALITASTGFTAAVTTTATATSGDVRGTYTLQTASNNTLRLGVFSSPSVNNISSATGLFGAAQYADF